MGEVFLPHPVEQMRRKGNHTGYWWKTPKERDYREEKNGKWVGKCILETGWGRMDWSDSG
jgi:hypothetical protein